MSNINIQLEKDIQSLDDFDKTIKECRDKLNKSKNKGYKTFFRGEANEKWKPKASIFRDDKIWPKEGELYNKVKECCPEFKNLTHFQALSKMQHYKLPTRLLDFTRDSHVALYFACADESEKDGKILLFCTDALNETDEKVDSICKQAFDSSKKKISKEDKGKEAVEAYFVQGEPTSLRMEVQKGLFLLVGCYGNEQSYCLTNEDGRGADYSGYCAVFPIKSCFKSKLLHELEKKNITRDKIYPNLEDKLVEIKKQVCGRKQ